MYKEEVREISITVITSELQYVSAKMKIVQYAREKIAFEIMGDSICSGSIFSGVYRSDIYIFHIFIHGCWTNKTRHSPDAIFSRTNSTYQVLQRKIHNFQETT